MLGSTKSASSRAGIDSQAIGRNAAQLAAHSQIGLGATLLVPDGRRSEAVAPSPKVMVSPWYPERGMSDGLAHLERANVRAARHAGVGGWVIVVETAS